MRMPTAWRKEDKVHTIYIDPTYFFLCTNEYNTHLWGLAYSIITLDFPQLCFSDIPKLPPPPFHNFPSFKKGRTHPYVSHMGLLRSSFLLRARLNKTWRNGPRSGSGCGPTLLARHRSSKILFSYSFINVALNITRSHGCQAKYCCYTKRL